MSTASASLSSASLSTCGNRMLRLHGPHAWFPSCLCTCLCEEWQHELLKSLRQPLIIPTFSEVHVQLLGFHLVKPQSAVLSRLARALCRGFLRRLDPEKSRRWSLVSTLDRGMVGMKVTPTHPACTEGRLYEQYGCIACRSQSEVPEAAKT